MLIATGVDPAMEQTMKKLAEFQRRIGVIDDHQWGPVTARAVANRLPFGGTALLKVPLSENFQPRELLVSEIAARRNIPNLPEAEQLEASRVFRRLLFVRRSYDERYKEQVFA